MPGSDAPGFRARSIEPSPNAIVQVIIRRVLARFRIPSPFRPDRSGSRISFRRTKIPRLAMLSMGKESDARARDREGNASVESFEGGEEAFIAS